MTNNKQYQIFDDPLRYYNAMIEDIENAKDNICMETYRIGNDSIGIRFKDALTKKSKEGVKVKLLIDSWGGSSLPDNFFNDMKKFGGELRFFKKIRINFDIFTKSHRRNHRKILIIDDNITYIGSSNITEYNLNWRELVLRMTGDIASSFKRIFNYDYRIYNKYIFDKVGYTQSIIHNGFEILREVPSITKQRINRKYVQLIKNAKFQVIIETPYFLPGFLLRKALMDAGKRGVDVKVIIPKHSDIRLIDILRNKYLGQLDRNHVKFLFYVPHNLHAKILLVDDELFSISSANFDYRSFRYQHEIAFIGSENSILSQLKTHVSETLIDCERFNYEKWKLRPLIQKFIEWLLLPIRHLL